MTLQERAEEAAWKEKQEYKDYVRLNFIKRLEGIGVHISGLDIVWVGDNPHYTVDGLEFTRLSCGNIYLALVAINGEKVLETLSESNPLVDLHKFLEKHRKEKENKKIGFWGHLWNELRYHNQRDRLYHP